MDEPTREHILKCSDAELASMIQKPEFTIGSNAWQFAQQEQQRRHMEKLSRPKRIEKWILAFTIIAVVVALITLFKQLLNR